MINGKYNSLRSFSSDRSYTLNRSSYARDSMMIEELLVPAKDQVRAASQPPGIQALYLQVVRVCSPQPCLQTLSLLS